MERVIPFIDYSTGGSLAGTIRAAEANIAAVATDTIVVPGHGPVAGRAELLECRDMLTTIRDAVAVLKKQGRTLEETIAAKPTARYDAKWGGFLIPARRSPVSCIRVCSGGWRSRAHLQRLVGKSSAAHRRLSVVRKPIEFRTALRCVPCH